jgi:hypothetical protein
MLLMILRVAYLLICAGAILAYITSDVDQTQTTLVAANVDGKVVMVPKVVDCWQRDAIRDPEQ